MPDTAFDRWTRRRIGQVAGALITAPILGAASPAGARHHHKKKKKDKNKDKDSGCLREADGQCEPVGSYCNPEGSPCCDCLGCEQIDDEFQSYLCTEI